MTVACMQYFGTSAKLGKHSRLLSGACWERSSYFWGNPAGCCTHAKRFVVLAVEQQVHGAAVLRRSQCFGEHVGELIFLESPPEAAVGPEGSGEEKATILVNLETRTRRRTHGAFWTDSITVY